MKKRTDSILNNPLRNPSSSGSGTNPSATSLDVERPHKGPDREDLMVFSCGASGDSSCAWEARAKDEDVLMTEIEKHFREKHNRELDESERTQVRRFCRSQNAA